MARPKLTPLEFMRKYCKHEPGSVPCTSYEHIVIAAPKEQPSKAKAKVA
jgi:hypothetical protein